MNNKENKISDPVAILGTLVQISDEWLEENTQEDDFPSQDSKDEILNDIFDYLHTVARTCVKEWDSKEH